MTDMWDENNGNVWELLVNSKRKLSMNEIVSELGIEDQDARICISKLINNKLALKEKNRDGKFFYSPITILDALHWAKAVEIGIPIEVLENLGQLDAGSMDDVLSISSDGTLEKHYEEIKENKIKERHNYLHGKAASEAAKTDLFRIVEDTKKAYEKAKLSGNEVMIVILYNVYIETENAYNTLINKYMKGRN